MKMIIDRPDLTIYHGNADEYVGTPDFIVTNPYGPIPWSLKSTPAIIHQWVHRKQEAEEWTHMRLTHLIGTWNRDQEAFWVNETMRVAMVTNGFPMTLDLSGYRPTAEGWYPEDMARQILQTYLEPGMTVWDGFMGRGTVGKITLEMGCRYIGVEQLEKHIAIAKIYLGIDT
jgi:hypothetical protein